MPITKFIIWENDDGEVQCAVLVHIWAQIARLTLGLECLSLRNDDAQYLTRLSLRIELCRPQQHVSERAAQHKPNKCNHARA
eukprot:scaffold5712_cov269-Prasinococcus_capsulatus_cf.AAC.1